MKKRYKTNRNDYRLVNIHKDLISTITKTQNWLQQQENKKHGKKAQQVSFVHASKEFNKFIKSMRGAF